MPRTAARSAAHLAHTVPDIVVLDVMLPDCDGFTLARQLRAAHGELPVLFLTARDGVDDRIAGLTAGGDDYVTKPFSLEELVLRLRGDLRAHASQPPTASGRHQVTYADWSWTRKHTRCVAPGHSWRSPRPNSTCCAT